jgi:cellobiose-specific phosphotransferase system component IIC
MFFENPNSYFQRALIFAVLTVISAQVSLPFFVWFCGSGAVLNLLFTIISFFQD